MKTSLISKIPSFFAKEHKDVIIVYAKWICPCSDEECKELITDGAIAIQKNKIVKVGKGVDVKKAYSHQNLNIKEIKLSPNHLIIPGLINCHCHLAMSLLRGYADDYDLQTWLTKFIWPTEQELLNEDFVYFGTLVACYEAIMSGTTMLNDSYFLPEAAQKAIETAGIRCILTQPLLDMGNNEIEQQFEKAKSFINKIQKEVTEEAANDTDSLLRTSVNPHACYTVPEKWLQKIKELQETANKQNPTHPLICHIHLHETIKERENYESTNGKSALQALLDTDLVNEHLVAAHCVHMTKDEIQCFAEKKANVCHCAKSNLKLGSGIADIPAMIDAGVNVCMGTDGAASNNSVNMLSEMNYVALLHKTTNKEHSPVSAHTVLKMATRNGSKALGRQDTLGSLEPGKLADFIAIDLAGPGNVGLPIYDPICHLMYSNHVKVTDVWINGVQVMSKEKINSIKLEFKNHEALLEKIFNKRKTLLKAYEEDLAQKTADISKIETTTSE